MTCDADGEVNQEPCDRECVLGWGLGVSRLNGSGSLPRTVDAEARNVDGTGGTGGMLTALSFPLNQNDDLPGIEGWDAIPACMRADAGRETWFWWVENDQLETESWRELALDVIHELPSRIASTSSVAKEGRAFSSTSRAGGQLSAGSFRAARLRLMVTRVRTSQPKAAVVRIATPLEYPTRPMKKVDTLVPASTPATTVEVATRTTVGAQMTQ